jgi:heme oxygenase
MIPLHGHDPGIRHTAARPGPRTSLRARLHSETSGLQQALESKLDLLSVHLSLERYRRVVWALHGYHAAAEPRMAGLAVRLRSDIPLRRLAPVLEEDLLVLGFSREHVAEGPPCTELPPLERLEHMAGCFYVLERVCLGGNVTARFIMPRLGLMAHHGCAYFSSGGAPSSPRWAEVMDFLDRVPPDADQDGIVESAAETFRTLRRWLAMQRALR